MCGIAGWLASSADPERLREDVAAMTACLVHRGPDDAGMHSGAGWAVGMRRLAVQDVSLAGHQPMHLDGLTLVYNGEVYNFGALRAELVRAGYEFRSGSDTEVVLAALHHWGTGALERFNGMFALVLIDERRRRALFARDRFGKKPLFVARLGRGVAFASELKALLAVARPELSISTQALREYFRYQYVPAPLSIFEQVEKLPAASWMEFDLATGASGAAVEYWTLPRGGSPAEAASPEELLETLREAVRRRLVADVPVGAFLSGGIDSSLVVACMRDVAADVRTFSIGFADPRFDESPWAKAIAERLETHHSHEQLSPGGAMDLLPRFIDAYDEPFADSSALATMAVSDLARSDVSVALSGDGGDELFGGYPRYRPGAALRLAELTPPVMGRPLQRIPGATLTAARVRRFGELAAARRWDGGYRERMSIWSSRELERLMPGTGDAPRRPNGEHCPRVEQMMRLDARTYLVDDILQKVDRASMQVSLEARNPLLDPSVVALAFRSISVAERAPGQKGLLRGALALRLPEEMFDRPKMGFAVPISEWLRGNLRESVVELVVERKEAEYDLSTAREVADAHLSGRQDRGRQLWSLLVFELWRRRWFS